MPIMQLEGRIAHCSIITCDSQAPSSTLLPFFSYQGDGTYEANLCAICKMHEETHLEIQPSTGRPGANQDHEWTPQGDLGFDRFYCGCRGWD